MSDASEKEVVGCIVGAVVQLKPEYINRNSHHAVREQLAECAGVEIHAEDEQSRLVITMEATTSKAVLHLTESIQNFDGVMAVTPVYQYDENNRKEEQPGGWRWR